MKANMWKCPYNIRWHLSPVLPSEGGVVIVGLAANLDGMIAIFSEINYRNIRILLGTLVNMEGILKNARLKIEYIWFQ